MIQGRIIDDQDCDDRYSEMIGKEYMATLKAAIEKEPLMLGIKVLKLPDQALKQKIEAAAAGALQMKDGVAAITMSDYLYILNELMNGTGIEHARMIIADREQKAEKTRQDNKLAAQKQQTDGNLALEQAKQKTMIMEYGLKMKENDEKEKSKAVYAMKVAENTSSNDILKMTADKTIDAMLQGIILPPQGQGGGQPAPQGQPPMGGGQSQPTPQMQ
jgi:hypothetical protein